MTSQTINAFIIALASASFACADKPSEMPSVSPVPVAPAKAGSGTVVGTVAGSGAGAIVTLSPADGRAVDPPAALRVMDQSGYEFQPGLLLAQAGQHVQFRNSEDVLHNVRVTEVATDTPVFNVATIPFGSYDHTFQKAGFYTVTCDIHSTMRADILIVETPYSSTTSANGSFTVPDVPVGSYKLTLYAGAGPVTRTVEVNEGLTKLEVTP